METDVVKQVKKSINSKRIEIDTEKASVDKLGEESIPCAPEDILVMFIGKEVDNQIKSRTAMINRLAGYKKAYPKQIVGNVKKKIEEYMQIFDRDFEASKKLLEKVCSQHPLWQKLSGIRGFSAYQLALIMCHIKDIAKFDTPSKLMVYSGLASIEGIPITKGNIHLIKDIYYRQGKEFNGFNTKFLGRMYVITDCLLRGQGYFYRLYLQIKERITQRCINNDETFIASKDDEKKSGGKMKKGRRYMNGKKNQSLDAFTNSNARRRIARVLLHLIYTEWRTQRELPVRVPYPVDYLGHDSVITLDQVLLAEKHNKPVRKVKSEAKQAANKKK